jgi:hypothetical protein
MNLPFNQEILNNKLHRTFLSDVDSDELAWHQDLRDRKVKIIEANNWQFQMDDELPITLKDNQEVFIPKLSWHRVIKGNGNLVVEIEEF